MSAILAMIAAAIAKNELIDKPAQRQNNELAAIQSAYAPLTGQQPTKSISGQPSSVGAGLKGGLTGWQMNQEQERNDFDRKLKAARLQYYLKNGQPEEEEPEYNSQIARILNPM